jgi:predicted O-linked N-acetylglucosamine transferase (SPINDLY family)
MDLFETAKNLFLDGLQHFQNQEFQDAEYCFLKSLTLVPNRTSTLNNLAATQIKLKKYDEAEKNLRQVMGIDENSIDLWLNLGILNFEKREFKQAISNLAKCVELDPNHILSRKLIAQVHDQNGEFNRAIVCLKKILQLNPNDLDALIGIGAILNDLKEYDASIQYHQLAIKVNPNFTCGYINMGVALSGLNKFDLALYNYSIGLELDPGDSQIWFNKGFTFHELKRYEEAIAHYDKALSLKPDYAEAWGNKGVTLQELKRYDEAIAYFDKALSLMPEYTEAWSNKGATLQELKRYDEAIAHFDKALSLKPDYAEAWGNKGGTLNELKRYDEAIAHYDKALSLKFDIDWIYGDLIHAKMKICNWSDYRNSLEIVCKKVIANQKVAAPFTLLSLTDNAALHKQSSEIYAEDRYPKFSSLEVIPKAIKKEKIRIAYFSPDFRNHPVSFLTSELFEIHNRDRFEVLAFSLQQSPVSDETNLRLRSGFDKFFDVGNMSDKEIAKFARENAVDIAIDLAGPTKFSRTGIFSYRAAPIQVNWLGYPGTIGADFIDYIVADRTIIPETHHKFYVEKVVCLPNTYMVDDSKRVASSRRFTREECGLPKNSVVFCCFNNDYKFNSQVLDGWARILLRVGNSVLWISENNQYFKTNITAEFEKRGLDRSRLIFAKRLELMADHLARYNVADLFLDTHPYNAHTTTVDSLKAGIPVLTLMGQSFASRVAASLLSAIGLPELITSTQEEYEALAIELAINPKKLADIKLKLVNNRLTTPLFDTQLFTKNIEDAYIKMMERYQANLKPDHIVF